MEFAVPSLAFVGTGTGGNNEGRGLYSSGVRGVAQDKYARGALGDPEMLYASDKVILDGERMTQREAAGMIARKLGYGNEELTQEERLFYYYVWPKTDPARGNEGAEREFLVSDVVDDLDRLEGMRKVLSFPVERKTFKNVDGNLNEVEVYVNPGRGPKFIPVRTAKADILQFEQKTQGIDRERVGELIEKMFPVPRPAVMEQTWFTNRPEGDVSHLLNWFEAVTPEQMGWIVEGARKSGFSEEEIAFLQRERIDDDDVLIEDGNRMPSGREMYMRLEAIAFLRDERLGRVLREHFPNVLEDITSDELWHAHAKVMGDVGKFASEFFVSADIDGMMYPVDYRHGNRDGRVSGWNYVAFSDEHLRVDHVYEYNPETDDFDLKWHESEGGATLRFTETPLGQELVAEAFDAIVGSRVDLLLRPSRFYGNPYLFRDGILVVFSLRVQRKRPPGVATPGGRRGVATPGGRRGRREPFGPSPVLWRGRLKLVARVILFHPNSWWGSIRPSTPADKNGDQL